MQSLQTKYAFLQGNVLLEKKKKKSTATGRKQAAYSKLSKILFKGDLVLSYIRKKINPSYFVPAGHA